MLLYNFPGLQDTEEVKNCTSRAIEEFPSNWFTLKQTQEGAIALHILLALYMFGALAIVCDDYFVPSLEFICDSKCLGFGLPDYTKKVTTFCVLIIK